jgi:hypothetical protein
MWLRKTCGDERHPVLDQDKRRALWSFDRFKEWVKRKDGHAF